MRYLAEEPRSWDNKKWDIVNTATSTSCVSINPMEKKPVWIDDDDLPEGRVRSLSLRLDRKSVV